MKLTIVFCFIVSITFAQAPGDLPPNAEPGKCYAKCLIEEAYEEYEIEVPVYTGDTNDKTVKRKKKKIVLQEGTTRWVKKKVDPNCESKDPNDCLVWYLEKVDRIVEERIVVKKPSKTTEYEMEVFTIRELNREGGFTEWKEVLCANEVTSYIIEQIQSALISEGYLQSGRFKNNRIDGFTKEALKEFQIDNDLPVGNLDLETLDALEIYY